MSENRIQDYFQDDNEGQVDTRKKNFECETPDNELGCDMGIDVQGELVCSTLLVSSKTVQKLGKCIQTGLIIEVDILRNFNGRSHLMVMLFWIIGFLVLLQNQVVR